MSLFVGLLFSKEEEQKGEFAGCASIIVAHFEKPAAHCVQRKNDSNCTAVGCKLSADGETYF